MKFADKKNVSVLTTQYTASFMRKSWLLPSLKQEHFKKLDHIKKYSTFMGAIDICDQDIEPYDCCRKTKVKKK